MIKSLITIIFEIAIHIIFLTADKMSFPRRRESRSKQHAVLCIYLSQQKKRYDVQQLKKWNRQWKINLIEKENPGWLDLFDGLL